MHIDCRWNITANKALLYIEKLPSTMPDIRPEELAFSHITGRLRLLYRMR